MELLHKVQPFLNQKQKYSEYEWEKLLNTHKCPLTREERKEYNLKKKDFFRGTFLIFASD
jgi:hypothetical protein